MSMELWIVLGTCFTLGIGVACEGMFFGWLLGRVWSRFAANRRKAILVESPCPWCGAMFSGRGRTCGREECVRARKRARMRTLPDEDGSARNEGNCDEKR